MFVLRLLDPTRPDLRGRHGARNRVPGGGHQGEAYATRGSPSCGGSRERTAPGTALGREYLYGTGLALMGLRRQAR
jgi:hypothetical protein